jgi:hypothetical protein
MLPMFRRQMLIPSSGSEFAVWVIYCLCSGLHFEKTRRGENGDNDTFGPLGTVDREVMRGNHQPF